MATLLMQLSSLSHVCTPSDTSSWSVSGTVDTKIWSAVALFVESTYLVKSQNAHKSQAWAGPVVHRAFLLWISHKQFQKDPSWLVLYPCTSLNLLPEQSSLATDLNFPTAGFNKSSEEAMSNTSDTVLPACGHGEIFSVKCLRNLYSHLVQLSMGMAIKATTARYTCMSLSLCLWIWLVS